MIGAELFLGQAVIALILIVAFGWLLLHSPVLSWLLKIVLTLLWGAGTVGAVLFTVFVIDLPKHQYGAAVVAIIVGSVICIPWVVIGVPLLWRLFKEDIRHLCLWD